MRVLIFLALYLIPFLAASQIEQDFELGNTGVTVTMVWIDPGSFMMGALPYDSDQQDDEHPRHPVTISEGFWIGKYELTQDQWSAVMGEWNFWWNDYQNLPAEMLSWNDIHDDFLPALNEGLDARKWRLPTEAEWEYCARAGVDNTRFWWGDDIDYLEVDTYSWYWENNTPNGTKPIGLKQPNPWGLHDIVGNVWEFCEDWYRPDYYNYSAIGDPKGPYSGRGHSVRGGAWRSVDRNTRPADRFKRLPHETRYCTGLRLVYNPHAQPEPLVLELVPIDPFIPSEGGPLYFTAHLTNNTGGVQTRIAWIEALSPHGVSTGTLAQNMVTLHPGTRTVSGLILDVPTNAASGKHTLIGRLSNQTLPNVDAYDSFEFEKLPAEQ